MNVRRKAEMMVAIGVVLVVGLLALPTPLLASPEDNGATALLRDANGNPVGVVKLTQDEDGGVLVRVVVHDLTPGFHGFHVHAIGACTPPSFTSAGGHFNPTSQSHPSHAGDMPVLLVNSDGTGEARFKTGRYTLTQLFDADGSAIIIHALPDNYANIPSRYIASPDATTLATGDAGGRAACGVIQSH